MEGLTPSPIDGPDTLNAAQKRKRSLSADRQPFSAPPAKAPKVHSSHLQINYLARMYSDILPLINVDDTLPNLLALIGDYAGVLDRHESLAGNLGARPLGPLLIKSFERLFEGPPRVLKTHGKEGTMVTWLDVVEFARHKPEQFNLEKMRDGVRVCQFYTKQSRVEISEEDYVLIASGMPQKLIPPQPIAEDEEKELGTLEILEKNIAQLIQLTDQVAARARQLNHRIRNRRTAIVSRREAEYEALSASENGRPRTSSPTTQGLDQPLTSNADQRDSNSPTSGFVAVNSRLGESEQVDNSYASETSRVQTAVSMNGKTFYGASASPATRAELLNLFAGTQERSKDMSTASDYEIAKALSASRPHSTSKHKSRPATDIADYANILLNSASPVPIPHTPSALANKAAPVDRFDDSGPYKAEMLSRMDSMQRGDRVLPPCDRCRRLHMDCLKNLTACLGCTKKHAKCSWKDVTEQELINNPHVSRSKDALADDPTGTDTYSTTVVNADGMPQGVPDEELLGEESDDGKDPLESNIGSLNNSAHTASGLVRVPGVNSTATNENRAPEATMTRQSVNNLTRTDDIPERELSRTERPTTNSTARVARTPVTDVDDLVIDTSVASHNLPQSRKEGSLSANEVLQANSVPLVLHVGQKLTAQEGHLQITAEGAEADRKSREHSWEPHTNGI